MPSKTLTPMALALCLCVAATGCDKEGRGLSLKGDKSARQPEFVIPPHVKGTVGEYAGLVGGGPVPVQAYGIVIALGDNGSSEVPAILRKELIEYLLKQRLGSPRSGTQNLTPERVLRDKDTAVVLIGGAVQPGAPVGTRFDVFVSALPQTQTRSLDGGIFMPVEMRLAFGGVRRPGQMTTILASAGGPVFVNPFLDPSDPEQQGQLLKGRIIGGGRVTNARPMKLQLRHPDYATADLIQRRIKERFPSETEVANAESRSMVAITIPPEFRGDYVHFLRLVLHLPIRLVSGEWELHARQIAEQMQQPAANHDELAMVWEATGRQVVPVLRNLYASTNPAASFYAARSGARLEDRLAFDVLLRFAETNGSPYQVPAIEEIGRYPRETRPASVLRKLVDEPNDLVRVAAYEALVRRGDTSTVTRVDVSGQFKLDIVASRRSYAVYATQTQEPKIVLFGRNMSVRRPIFFESPGELVTINAFGDSAKMTVFRKIQRSGQYSDPYELDFSVRALVQTLGTRPELDQDGRPLGLGLTYSQVVSVLYRLCKQGDIPARFVLQPIPELQRIYEGAASVGRPDMSGL